MFACACACANAPALANANANANAISIVAFPLLLSLLFHSLAHQGVIEAPSSNFEMGKHAHPRLSCRVLSPCLFSH